MKDNYGNELKVGDAVAYIRTSGKTHKLLIGKILEIRNKFGRERAIMEHLTNTISKGVEGVSIIKLQGDIDVDQMRKQYIDYHGYLP